MKKKAQTGTIDRNEIQHFTKDSAQWWDEDGPFKPLHRLNPVRMSYIKDKICKYYNKDTNDIRPLSGLDIVDIGCGGGLVCEPLSRMGANVYGVDGDAQAIDVAQEHAAQNDLDITYTCGEARNLGRKFDVVCALEVAEHVSDLQEFMRDCADLLKPDGILIMSTLNRTAKSYALGIIAAEYLLRWVPRGTHSWRKFIKPSELSYHARQNGLLSYGLTGLIFNPLENKFALSDHDFDVNYLIAFKRNL